jgi:hypothetical protein
MAWYYPPTCHVRPRADNRMKHLLNPYLIGIVICLLFWIGAFACVIWAPWVLDRGNRWWQELVFVSLCVLGVLLDEFWSFHKRLRFWEGLAIFAAANAIIVRTYCTTLRKTIMKQAI